MLNKIEIDSVIRGGLWKAAFLHNPNFWHNQNPMDCYLEMGFLCPPAGMNLYFASAMFGKPVRAVAVAVIPAILAMLAGALLISAVPWLATALPNKLLQF